MADAYLCWKYPSDPDLDDLQVDLGEIQDPLPPTQSPLPANDSTTAAPPVAPDNTSLPQAQGSGRGGMKSNTPSPSTLTEVEILVIDIYTLSTSIKFSYTGDQTGASTLAGLGFIGNAPFRPSVAISIKTLELYRVLRRRKPSFSVEGFVKVISDLYMVRMSSVTHDLFSLHTRPHIAPSTAVYSQMHSMRTSKSSELSKNVSKRLLVTMDPTGVCSIPALHAPTRYALACILL